MRKKKNAAEKFQATQKRNVLYIFSQKEYLLLKAISWKKKFSSN